MQAWSSSSTSAVARVLGLRNRVLLAIVFVFLISSGSGAQQIGGAGTVEGNVTDPTGAVIPGATVEIANPVSGFHQSTTTDGAGQFVFRNVPQNNYHLDITAKGFKTLQQDVLVRSGVPVALKLSMAVAPSDTTVEVNAEAADLLENTPTSHTDIDQNVLTKLPVQNSSSSLNSVLTLATPGVVADSNGFFHPLGDHAQTQFSIDGQPITDQQNRSYSNQVATSAIQSLEVITGVPPAEFGDKDSLVVRAITKSGLGQTRPTGSITTSYGSFGTADATVNFGIGNQTLGNFVSMNGLRSGRYLDSPEFNPLHDIGNSESIFDRADWQHGKNSFHLDLFGARSWFQIPNTYDQAAAGQDQTQQIRSFNVAPGWTRTVSPQMLVTANAFVRQDQINYRPSFDPFSDQPATVGQNRRLTNYGFRGDVSYVKGRHNAKAGFQVSFTDLKENFALGVTDPAFNPVCFFTSGAPVPGNTVTAPSACAGAGFLPNTGFQPGLLPFDLTRSGRLFSFNGSALIKQQAFYAQDAISFGRLLVNVGVRGDNYDGLSTGMALEPRVGLSYQTKKTGTVLKFSYGREFETPYNENLVLSSATGGGGLATNVFGAVAGTPLRPGRRDHYNVGVQQALGNWVVIDANYFWKFTQNAFDFDTLFNTPIAFPIEWRKSNIDGASVGIHTIEHHGLSIFTVMGHTRARFFNPENGGIIFNSPLATGPFRIDHDQAFEQTTNLYYRFLRKFGGFGTFTWRYDSGEVAGSVPDAASALVLTADQQAGIGLFCGSTFATLTSPIRSCSPASLGATLVRIPSPGTANPDTNPPRIAPRHLFDLSTGFDNVFRGDREKVSLHFSVLNLTNKVALYNFLSTFSGTHFIAPRTYQAELGFSF
jgi:Carboxypeptidase regulatory-like domain